MTRCAQRDKRVQTCEANNMYEQKTFHENVEEKEEGGRVVTEYFRTLSYRDDIVEHQNSC